MTSIGCIISVSNISFDISGTLVVIELTFVLFVMASATLSRQLKSTRSVRTVVSQQNS